MQRKSLTQADIQRMITGHYQQEKIKNVIGMVKKELTRKVMTEFGTLREKMYPYRTINKKLEDKRWNSTTKCVVAENLHNNDYKTCLFDGKTKYRKQMLFENKKQEVYKVNKYQRAIEREDNKRRVEADGITTLASGYLALYKHQRFFVTFKGYKNILFLLRYL